MKKMFLFFISLIILFGSCATSVVQNNRDVYFSSVRGSDVNMKVRINKVKVEKMRGELIAVLGDSIAIRSYQFPSVEVIHKNRIEGLKFELLTLMDPIDSKEKSLRDVNSLLPLVHGWWMIVTYPINISVINATKYKYYKLDYPLNIEWNELHKFARFPQGLPEGIDISQIK